MNETKYGDVSVFDGFVESPSPSAPVSHVIVSGGGLKYNKGKPPMELIEPLFELAMARVLGFGAAKYTTAAASGRDNWKKGIPIRDLIGSMKRHLAAWARGIDNDEESSESHLAHLAVNAMFAFWLAQMRPDLDDRDGVKR